MSNDQQLVDYLYNAIFSQQLRCAHLNSVVGQQINSVWNKHTDEKKILDKMVDRYKNFYKEKIELLKTHFHIIKEYNVNSFLTYDRAYYISKYNQHIEELDKYLIELELKTLDTISKEKLSSISEEIDIICPYYLVDPTLLGLIKLN
jgi:hypothetical protein